MARGKGLVMAKVAKLKVATDEVEESVVRMAEEILALAKSERGVGLAAVLVAKDGSSLTRASATSKRHHMIGAVSMLLHDLLHGKDDG
jgi:peptide deformylase